MKKRFFILFYILVVFIIFILIFSNSIKKLDFDVRKITKIEMTSLNPYQKNQISPENIKELITKINSLALTKPHFNSSKGFSFVLRIFEGRRETIITIKGSDTISLGNWTYYVSSNEILVFEDYLSSIIPK